MVWFRRLIWPNPLKPLCFLDCVDGEEETTTEGYSWRNREEAKSVMNIVERLISDPDISGDIGVIAPYAAQVCSI
jgi:superfamily I DNA and/or RNA helicase